MKHSGRHSLRAAIATPPFRTGTRGPEPAPARRARRTRVASPTPPHPQPRRPRSPLTAALQPRSLLRPAAPRTAPPAPLRPAGPAPRPAPPRKDTPAPPSPDHAANGERAARPARARHRRVAAATARRGPRGPTRHQERRTRHRAMDRPPMGRRAPRPAPSDWAAWGALPPPPGPAPGRVQGASRAELSCAPPIPPSHIERFAEALKSWTFVALPFGKLRCS